jgi:geranylgeranyl pyrophosphate synthase
MFEKPLLKMQPGCLPGSCDLKTSVSFIVPIQEDIQAIEALMRAQAEQYHPDIAAALELLLLSGGKRIRPALTMLMGRIFSADRQRLLYMASAIELLHTATLVHDDLIDGSLLRRGTPTLNAQWSAGATVLTGDFIFARAANMAANTDSIEVMKLFSRTLATIVNGEITQLFRNRCKADRSSYLERIYAKTASLFETSAQSAAIISNAGRDQIEAARVFDYNVGLAFQIIDDLLDFTGEQATLGKPVGSDLRQGIVTLPAILFAEQNPTDPDSRGLIEGICLEDLDQIDRLVGKISSGSTIRDSHREACKYIDAGLAVLNKFPATNERFALEELATYIVQRDF